MLAAGLLLSVPGALGAQSALCNQPAARPIAYVPMPVHPFQAIPTSDGCWIFVSLPAEGAPEPGAKPKGPRHLLKPGMIALVHRTGGKLEVARTLKIEGSPWGMALTHDGKLLVVSDDDRMAFVDVPELISGAEHPTVHYVNEAPLAGRTYANVSKDDRYAFFSDETVGTITVFDLAKARRSGFGPQDIVGKIPAGISPVALVFSADGRYLYATIEVAPRSWSWPGVCKAWRPDVKRRHPQGAILVIDVKRAESDPAHSVVGTVPAGCSPVRLVTSPTGDTAYVTARRDNAVLAFDTKDLLRDTARALIARVPVGTAPVGIAVLEGGRKVVATISNRFATGPAEPQSLSVIDVDKIGSGASAISGTIPAGGFPRELRLMADGRTLLVTNYATNTLEVVDLARVLEK
jgi:DNA-binding beta-propeller fold protein YncE